MNRDYRKEMEYKLDLARSVGAASIVDDVLSLLFDLAEAMASKTLTADEREEKTASLRSLALEMQDSPEMLNKLKLANVAWVRRYGDDINTRSQVLEARDAIVRVACPFLERYLYITFSELKAYVEAYRAQKEATSPPRFPLVEDDERVYRAQKEATSPPGRSLTQMPR